VSNPTQNKSVLPNHTGARFKLAEDNPRCDDSSLLSSRESLFVGVFPGFFAATGSSCRMSASDSSPRGYRALDQGRFPASANRESSGIGFDGSDLRRRPASRRWETSSCRETPRASLPEKTLETGHRSRATCNLELVDDHDVPFHRPCSRKEEAAWLWRGTAATREAKIPHARAGRCDEPVPGGDFRRTVALSTGV
jgi:hypothetical protein